MNPTFWHAKRVLLTGHTGFKGSWLSLWLQAMGAQLVGFALKPPTTPSLFELANVAPGMTSIVGDIRDLPSLRAAMQQHQPEIVFHMAAQPLVRLSYQNPVETYSTNVMGTAHVLEAVRNCPSVRAVVNITTDKCYENREWAWGYRENEPLGGHDPYSSSKGCAELVTAAYRNSFFQQAPAGQRAVAVATARAGNVIGGGDWAQDRLVPDLLSAFASGRPVEIRNPHAVRPWQHVLEPLRGYLMLAEQLYLQGADYAEAWNFGPHDEDSKPVGWIVQQMAALWGSGAQWKCDTAAHPHEAHYLKLDISKARSRLDWQPALRLVQALDLSIAWARQHQAGADMHAFTNGQIAAYQTLTQH
jgi:CDP-glucose 4,6-dehydratase